MKLFESPWAARETYISTWCSIVRVKIVIRFMTEQAKRELFRSGNVTGLKLLELQRYLMLMYTSCGWFFR